MIPRLRKLHARLHDGEYSFLEPRYAARLSYLWMLDRVGRRRYSMLSERMLLDSRTSDTAFVFGSGRSLLELGADEWERIEGYNTISLREFPRQRWVHADYHLTSEVDFPDEYAHRICDNPLYRETIFVVQGGWRAERGNEIVGRGLLPAGARMFRFRRTSRGIDAPPSERLDRGLVHGYNSIFDGTNLAILLGFRHIVLAGVDLYNKEYFWLAPSETRSYEKVGVTAERPFGGADRIVRMLGDWHDLLLRRGVVLSVYNPRSLLAGRLPVFAWSDAP